MGEPAIPSGGYLGIESVVNGTSDNAIDAIFAVHFPDAGPVADLTWGKGRFWNGKAGERPIIGFDIAPHSGCQIGAEYQHVPLRDQSVDVATFDPPFIFSNGILRTMGTSRFFLGDKVQPDGSRPSQAELARPKNAKELLEHTVVAAMEMRRIARKGMIFKGQDLITNKPNWWSYQVMNALHFVLDMLPADMLIQIGKHKPLRDKRWKKQHHFRRSHSIYLIYKW